LKEGDRGGHETKPGRHVGGGGEEEKEEEEIYTCAALSFERLRFYLFLGICVS
jgi:hypothetical protein